MVSLTVSVPTGFMSVPTDCMVSGALAVSYPWINRDHNEVLLFQLGSIVSHQEIDCGLGERVGVVRKSLVATIRVFETCEERRKIDNHLFVSLFEEWKKSLGDNVQADDIDLKYLSEVLRRTNG